MSDLTTTMPILVVPSEDADVRSAPPGEPGHFHTDDGSGRHRGGSRVPRGLIVTFGVAVVAGIGLVASGVFDGGSSSNGSAVAQPGSSSTPGGAPTTPGDPTPSGGVAQGPNDPASAGPSGASQSTTPSHPRTSTKPRPTTVAPTPTSAGNATQSAPPARPTSTSTPTPFQPLSQGMTGQAVSDMQQLLVQDGYLDPGGYQDGTFDSITYFAVRQFQRSHQGTSADGRGVYGVATNAALRQELHLTP